MGRIRLSYAQLLLGSLPPDLLEVPSDPGLVELRCQGSQRPLFVPRLVLAAMSPSLLDQALSGLQASEEAVLLAPGMFYEDASRFFGHLLGKDSSEFSLADLQCVERVGKCMEMGQHHHAKGDRKVKRRKSSQEEVEEASKAKAACLQYTFLWGKEGNNRPVPLESGAEAERMEEGEEGEMEEMTVEEAHFSPLFARRQVGSGNIACAFCPKKYHQVKAKNKHMLTEHKEACKERGWYFSCGFCEAKFTSQMGREKHQNRLHRGRKKKEKEILEEDKTSHEVSEHLLCPFAHENENKISLFAFARDLRAHVKECHPDKDRSCLACGKDCASREALLEHIHVHSGSDEARPFFPCDRCDGVFISEYALIAHKRDAHSTAQSVKCQLCDKVFKNEKFRKNHEEVKHPGGRGQVGEAPAFECRVALEDGTACGKTFGAKPHLERHLRSHTGHKPFRCPECGKSFVDSTRLKQHRWIHTGHSPYKCEECGRGFRHLSHLRQHKVRAHDGEKGFECHVCDKRFVYAYQLRTHVATTHEKKEKDKSEKGVPKGDLQTFFQCSLCQAMFESYAAMEEHCEARHKGAPGEEVVLQVQEEEQEKSGKESEQYVIVYDL